jgi:UDP-xylose/UDP-N-acetylglucosamine transporter B4
MLFITAQQLPSFITWNKSSPSWFPRLKPRQVPIAQWLLQVSTFASGTLLNNIVFAFNVPPTIQIVFRSAGKLSFAHPPPLIPFLLPTPLGVFLLLLP